MDYLPFTFHVPERKLDHFDKNLVFDLLTKYLQPKVVRYPEEVAADVIKHMKKGGSEDHEGLASLLFEIGCQIPYHNVAQLKFVGIAELLGSPRGNLKPVVGVDEKFVEHTKRLSVLNSLLEQKIHYDKIRNPNYFININAFCALLSAGSLWTANPTFAVRCLRAAFENGVHPDKKDYARVIAAAQWIIFYGHALYKQITWFGFKLDPHMVAALHPGPLYKASGKEREFLDKPRWDFRKRGFATAENNKQYPEECRNAAEKAARIMEQLERDMVFSC